jgi:hypothetical protein
MSNRAINIFSTFLILTILLLSLGCKNNESQSQASEKLAPTKPSLVVKTMSTNYKKFIQGDYIIKEHNGEMSIVTGDFNKDEIPDFATIITRGTLEPGHSNNDIRLAFFHGNTDGNYIFHSQSDKLDLTFIYNKDFNQLKLVNKNVISVTLGAMRHSAEIKLRYRSTKDEYELIGSELENYGSGTYGPTKISTNFSTKKRLTTNSKIDGEGTFKYQSPETSMLDFDPPVLSELTSERLEELIGGN